jgi:mRNA interferase HigB
MRVLSRARLRAFERRHPDATAPIASWWTMMRRKTYRTPHEVRRDFPSADFLGRGLTVFDLGGNRFRLVAHIRYDLELVFVKHVVTHAEYDRLVL